MMLRRSPVSYWSMSRKWRGGPAFGRPPSKVAPLIAERGATALMTRAIPWRPCAGCRRRLRSRAHPRRAAAGRAGRPGAHADSGLLGRQARADREPVPQGLRDRHNVGRDPGPFMREQFAGAAHPALRLVIDEDQPVLVADRA